MKRPWIIAGIVTCILVGFCCVCLFAILLAGYFYNQSAPSSEINVFNFDATPTTTPIVIRPTGTQEPTLQVAQAPDETDLPTPTAPVEQMDTLQVLQHAVVPINDLYSIAARLEGKEDVPTTLEPPLAPLQVGARDTFWFLNTETNENLQAQATLRYVTDHTYFWIEDGLPYREKDLRDLAETFEHQIYPTDRDFFGSEWTPGVDGDPHIYILYTQGVSGNTSGYFSSRDSFNPLVAEYSNGHEMFIISADLQELDHPFTYGVLAHEFQHMIHWYHDRNETSWLNEGFSDLAMLLNGYGIGGHDYVYAEDTDVQFTEWPADPNETIPHYGASFLFVTYFLDRFGPEATQALVANLDNDMDSIQQVLAELGAKDPLTGEDIQADDLFIDWVLANYLHDEDIDDGRYSYHDYADAPQTAVTETQHACDPDVQTRDVHQFGADYIEIKCHGSYTLNFEGTTQTRVLPADPFSGSYAFWSNKGDESDMTLTQRFDFTGHSGPLTLSYWTWYDLEKDFDYAYLEASTDGENWQILTTPSGTAEDISGNNYGWGYNGLSNSGYQWIREEVDISQFAGQEVLLRFEYITDAAVNTEGFLLDDVTIPEIGYFSDFEHDDGGWQAEGWVRIGNVLPQTFRVALVKHGAQTTVEQIPLSADNSANIQLDVGGDIRWVTLVVTGTTQYTRQKAAYRYFFTP